MIEDVNTKSLDRAEKISKISGFPLEEIAIIKNTVAKNTNDVELAYFLSICKSVSLNPMMKEIWCYKDNKGNLLVFAGRDGFLKRAQESQLWNGITSFEVCEKDDFEMNVTEAKIKHIPNFKDRGEIIGAYAIVKPKGCEYPTIEWADVKIYDKGYNAWKTHKADMIKKVAEIRVLKKAFGITILQSEFEFDVDGGVAMPMKSRDELDGYAQKIIDALETYTGKDKETLREICIEKRRKGEFNLEFAKNMADDLGIKL